MIIKAKHSDQLTTRLPCMDRFFKTRLRVTWQLIYFGLLLNYSAENCAVVQNQIGLYPPTFPTLCKDIALLMRLSPAIGLLARRVGAPKAGLCQSMTNRLDPLTFPTLCKDITLLMRLKSLTIGLPASQVNSYLR